MPQSPPLLLVNIGQLLTLKSTSGALEPLRGAALRDLAIVRDAAVLCIAGKIVSVGTTKDALRDPWVQKNRKKILEIDCERKVVLPGFVDSHTHPAFMVPRLVDFEKRIGGATYEEIAQAGGGIRSSIESVRAADQKLLSEQVLDGLRWMAEQGTTTIEAKSGYGLSLESELKSLRAIRQAAARWPGTVIATLLGAHVVPSEFKGRSQKYVELVCKEMIPQAAQQKLARFVDVFTDRGAFSPQETATIFAAARKHNLSVRGHVCQLTETRLGPLMEFEPVSLDHMDHVNDDDIRLLARSETIATLVPGANYFLGLDGYAPARKLIDSGVAVALATDYNPGSSPTPSMPFVLSLACTHMRMSPAEAIAAATINGAFALKLEKRKGTVEPGKDADLAVFAVEDFREIPYWFAADSCAFTLLGGERISSGPNC
ncbi:MAG TPA: imidazolonepropionase [Terriglobales bacterium]|jgi:imidazolonepropionase